MEFGGYVWEITASRVSRHLLGSGHNEIVGRSELPEAVEAERARLETEEDAKYATLVASAVRGVNHSGRDDTHEVAHHVVLGRRAQSGRFALECGIDVNPRLFKVLGEELHAGNFAALTAELFGGSQRARYFANNAALCEAGRFVEHLPERDYGPRGAGYADDHRVLADDDFDAAELASRVRAEQEDVHCGTKPVDEIVGQISRAWRGAVPSVAENFEVKVVPRSGALNSGDGSYEP